LYTTKRIFNKDEKILVKIKKILYNIRVVTRWSKRLLDYPGFLSWACLIMNQAAVLLCSWFKQIHGTPGTVYSTLMLHTY